MTKQINELDKKMTVEEIEIFMMDLREAARIIKDARTRLENEIRQEQK